MKFLLPILLSANSYAGTDQLPVAVSDTMNTIATSIGGVGIPHYDLINIENTVKAQPNFAPTFTPDDAHLLNALTNDLVNAAPLDLNPEAAKICVERCTTAKDGTKTCWTVCYEN